MSKIFEEMDFDYFSQGKHRITVDEFFESDDVLLLDVRTKEELDMIHFPLYRHCDVIHIPLNELPKRYDELPKDRKIAIFCSGTQRASIAFGYLRAQGYDNARILLASIDTFASYFKPGILKKVIRKKQKQSTN